jgi:hypothetical protein
MIKVCVFSKDSFLFKEIEDNLKSDVLLDNINEETEISKKLDSEILIILNEIASAKEILQNFRGLIFDLTGIAKNLGLKSLELIEPSVYLLYKYFGEQIDCIKGNIYYPVCIYGKAGIDDLINQTKDIFAFTNTECKILDKRLPFNALLGMGYNRSGIGEYISRFNSDVPNNFDLRLLPLSTFMIIDIYKPLNVEIYGEYLESEISVIDALNNGGENKSHNLFLMDEERATIVADYLKVIVEQIDEKINEYRGA